MSGAAATATAAGATAAVGRRRTAFYYAIVAAAAALLLAAVVPFGPFPLRVPFHHGGDALLLADLAKGVAEDGPFHLDRIGAPAGADVVDWPLGMWLPFAFTTGVIRVTGEAGLAINMLWLGATVLTAVSAAWAFRRLGHAADLSFVLALAYAFLPYGFYRNVDHVNLVFPLVPPLALLCLRACGATASAPHAGERRLVLLACFAQGLCFIYYSFFATWLLLVGTGLGWLRTRRREAVRTGALGLLLLVGGAAVPLVPSAVYWSRHGRNEKLQYKAAAESDALGLKLRHLLLPIGDHPLAPLRYVEERVRHAGFPDENENATARLGTLGAAGLLLLLGYVIARAVGRAAPDEALGPPAALVLAALLLAQVGGLGSLFNVLVSPDIRAYNRIVVFVAFFALQAVAGPLGRALGALPRARLAGAWRLVLLALLGAAVLGDQVPRGYLRALRRSGSSFADEAEFIERVERELPPRSLVFQLPHATIPVDLGSRAPMDIYDPGRAFLHSRTLRWSWGSVLGRGDWQGQVSRLTPAAMTRRLALAGFSGIWIDRWGYPPAEALPWTTLESGLTAAAGGAPPIASRSGRYSFLRLDAPGERLARELGPEALARARRDALAAQSPVLPRWREGCSDEQGSLREPSRVCGASGWAVLKNDSPAERRLWIEARFRALRPGTLTLRGTGFEDVVPLAGAAVPYRRLVSIAPGRRLRLAFVFAGPCEATSTRPRCVEILAMRAEPADAGEAAP